MFRLALVLCLSMLFAPASAQKDTMTTALTEWEEKWDNSLAYTLKCLDLLTDEELAYQPTTDQMSAHEQLRHMAGNMYGLSNRYLDGADESAAKRHDGMNRRELIDMLMAAHAYAATSVKAIYDAEREEEIVDFFAGKKSRRVVANLLQDHATHHRAQLIVYLRLLGHKPPRYTGW